mgnify:CR=1 FL=1
MDIIEDVSNAIIKASTNLSEDKFNALKKAISVEDNENALWALNQILEYYKVASKTKFPLCDDTGIPHVIIEIGEKREITGELIAQINEGIEQINDVVQTNSATAEECAASSQEMSNEAENLRGMIRKFKVAKFEK